MSTRLLPLGAEIEKGELAGVAVLNRHALHGDLPVWPSSVLSRLELWSVRLSGRRLVVSSCRTA